MVDDLDWAYLHFTPGSHDRSDARWAWGEIQALDSDTAATFDSNIFALTFMNDYGAIINRIYNGDTCDLPMCSSRDPQCDGLWELWRSAWTSPERAHSGS